MKVLRLLAAVIIIAGVCLTIRAAYMHAKAELAGVLIRRAWERSLQSGQRRPPWPWADTYPIARLRIPRLDYDEIVLEGATARTLAFGPARLLSGPRLGEPGNLVIVGHRTSWFRRLEGVAAGDEIQIQWFDSRAGRVRERTYSVSAIQVEEPQGVTLLAPSSEDVLTLFTCYPFGPTPDSPQRYAVRALPLASSHLAQSSY